MLTIETNRDWHAHWERVGERSTREDLLRQVERTIGGATESLDQIDLLVGAIARRLELGQGDVLLDLCCGNGLVTARLAALCRAVVGVDFSQELVATAQERNSAANITYLHRSAEDLHAADFPMGRPSKVCMNSGLQYFTEAAARRLLRMLRGMVAHPALIYFSDVPDAAKLAEFYDSPARWAEFEHRRAAGTEAIGTWWDHTHLASLLSSDGFVCEIFEPDQGRTTARYRFDLLGQLRSRRHARPDSRNGRMMKEPVPSS